MNDKSPWGPGPVGTGLFLAIAVILFGGLLTGYALLRLNDPGAFAFAPTLLDRRLGLAVAVSLLAICLAGGGALRLAMAGRPGPARALLSVALLAAVAVLGLRAFELPATSRRAGFLPALEHVSQKGHGAPGPAAAHIGDPSAGKRIFLGTCAACHAPDGSGVKGQGQNLRESTYLKDKTDDRALAFVKAGRQPFDPESKLHLAMPARGGNPALTDANLLDAIAYVRELQKAAAAAPRASAAPAATAAGAATKPLTSDQPQIIDGELWIPHTILPQAQAGPDGTAHATIALQKPGGEAHLESNVRRFFLVVLLANGLHALFVLFGVALGAWLLIAASRVASPRAALATAAVYWIVIGAIGLFLIPAFYA
jgi:mono/diheme cytochrome c family protein